MKISQIISRKSFNLKNVIIIVLFLALDLSIAFNVFHISGLRSTLSSDDALVLGRMVKSERDGLFSSEGFPGVIYEKSKLPDSITSRSDFYDSYLIRDQIFVNYTTIENQYKYYLGEDNNIPNDFFPYTSQSGGNSLLMSCINNLLPLNPYWNLRILRFITASLLSFVLFLFIGWVYRNFGLIESVIVYILIFLSPWFVFLGSSLWWCVWVYFIPFLVMLLLLEQRHKYPNKVTELKIFGVLFITVFLKHLLFGFEFVTTILLAIYPPVIYYYWIEKRKISSFIYFTFKAGLVAISAVILQSFLLVLQISSWKNKGLDSGIEYIMSSFMRRSATDDLELKKNTYLDVLNTYFNGDAFGSKLMKSDTVFLSYLLFIIIVLGVSTFIYFYSKKQLQRENKKYVALFITTLFSILCSLSWFIIFVDHASQHPHRDFIVWYVPFMLYCFLIVGIFMSVMLSKISALVKLNQSTRKRA